jgi:hypothetical protein
LDRREACDDRLAVGGRRKPQFASAWSRRRWSPIATGALVLICQGCAVSYTDESGARHAIGLLDVAVHSPAAPETFAGSVVEITSFGLSVGRTAQGGYLTAGYNWEVTAALRDNALVLGNPIALLGPVKQDQSGTKQ